MPAVLAPVYLSRPAVVLPERSLDNDQVIAAVRSEFRGDPLEWPDIEAGIRMVFSRCNAGVRHLDATPGLRVGAFAAQAGRRCLEEQGLAPTDLARLLYCGVAREDFEPATAMEVAAHLGVQTIHAFDVTSACVGQLEGIQIARAFTTLDPEAGPSLIVSGELTRAFLSYQIHSRDDLVRKAAGLTIGNAAAAWVVSPTPLPAGCLAIQAAHTFSKPQHWELCRAPIDGTFTSMSQELFRLHHYVPDQIRAFVGRLGWSAADVDHYVLHQPSDQIVGKVLTALEVDPERAVRVHNLYGNTVSTSVALAMHHTLAHRTVRAGDRFVLASAAAGFSLVLVAGVWVE